MMYAGHKTVTCMVSMLMLFVLCACSPEKSDRQSEKKLSKQERKREKAAKRGQRAADNRSDQAVANADVSRFASTGCDDSLWSHVYDPTRLEKLAGCVAVTGTVEESAPDDDGDQHFLLKLDLGQEDLINKKNRKKKNGNLVIEIVCANRVSLAKAKAACIGYKNRIPVPDVGAHVKVTGSYVIDSHNGWAEVHPVSKLDVVAK